MEMLGNNFTRHFLLPPDSFTSFTHCLLSSFYHGCLENVRIFCGGVFVVDTVKISVQQSNRLMVTNHIDEYVVQLKLTSIKNKRYYINTLADFILFHGKDCRELSTSHCVEYFEYLERVHQYKKISKSILDKKVKIITGYLTYLHHKNIGDFAGMSTLN